MPTYLYCCEKTQQEFEAIHSINEELQECPKCKENNLESHKPKRLIANTSFVLVGDCWARDNYK